MKKTIIINSLLLLLVSLVCRAESISIDSAMTIANRFLHVNKASWQVDIKKNPGQLYASSKSGSSPTCYIFKGSDNHGFVIVSADDISQPILGYSFDAKVPVTDDLPPAMQDWLDDIEQQIQSAREAGMEKLTNQTKDAGNVGVGNIKVKLETAEWNQGAPYNNDCPLLNGERCLTGCHITALAILMRYYQYPSAGTGSTLSYTTESNGIYVPSRNLNHNYNWSSMPLKYSKSVSWDQVSTLMADVGAAALSDYGITGTNTYIGKGESAIYKYFNYNPGNIEYKSMYSANDWYNKLRNELNQKH